MKSFLRSIVDQKSGGEKQKQQTEEEIEANRVNTGRTTASTVDITKMNPNDLIKKWARETKPDRYKGK
jgi:hypothetical protein